MAFSKKKLNHKLFAMIFLRLITLCHESEIIIGIQNESFEISVICNLKGSQR